MTTASDSIGKNDAESAPPNHDPDPFGSRARSAESIEPPAARHAPAAVSEGGRWFSVWSRRPSMSHLAFFAAAYVLGCGFAKALAIVPGTGISVWLPCGLFIATLVLVPRGTWMWWVLAGGLAELFSNALWFHNPLPVALVIFAGNALGAVAGAWLINRYRRPGRLETLQEVLTFVVPAAGLAPVISATVGSAALAWFGLQSFASAWPLWWMGDAAGVLIVALLAPGVFQDWHGKVRLTSRQWMEAGILGLFFLGVTSLALSGYLPFAYIIMLLLIWAALRFEFRGAAVALALLALVTAVFTSSGTSHFSGDPQSQRHNQLMLYLFLVISAFSAFVVAALSRQHQVTLSRLRESERQLQQMIDAVPTPIWRMTPEGIPSYLNERYTDITGVGLKDLIAPDGTRFLALAHPDDREAVDAALSRSLETGAPFVWKYRQRRADGSYRWVEARAEPSRDEAGAIAHWYGVSVDIEDMVLAQEDLSSRERELSLLVDMVPVHIRRLTTEGEPVFFNKRLTDFLGVDVQDLGEDGRGRLAAAMKTLIHPDDSARLLETVRHALATGEGFSMKYRMRRADGAFRWVDARAEPLRDEAGAVVQWYAISIDIDDEVQLYKQLEEREARIRRLVDSDVIGIVFWDLDGRIIETNDAFLRMVQYDREDFERGLRWFDMTPPEWQEVHARDELEELETTGKMQAREKEFFRKDGSRVPVLIGAASFEGGSRQGVAYILDLTEHKRAEAALRRSELQLQQLVDTVPVQIWCVSPGGDPAYINKTMMDYIGLKLEDFEAQGGGLPSAIQTLVHPDDTAALQEALFHSFSTGEPFALTFRNRRADGAYRWQEGRAEPLRDEDGRIIRWFGANIDIDDFVVAQEALRESERSLWQLVETLPVMVDCAAPDGEPRYRSRQLCEFLGYPLEQLDGTGKSRLAGTLDAGVHPDDVAGVKEDYARSLVSGEPYARVHRLRRFDGEYRWVDTRAAPMRNAEGAIVQWNVTCLDIDGEIRAQQKLRLAQESLARASQAASLAELSASIAHEVNQPLAAVAANAQACQRWLAVEPPNLERARRTVALIIRDVNSAADVVSHIRALFKRTVEPRSDTALGVVIEEVRNLVAEEAVRRNVGIDVDVERGIPLIALDRVQIQQVLVNLIRNGMDAMDTVAGNKTLRIRVRRIGEVVQAEISDRGQGIDFPEKMFEPFFTTKEQGMGMGLAISRSIVESHGGRLWAEKNEPQGATFIFTLPVQADASA